MYLTYSILDQYITPGATPARGVTGLKSKGINSEGEQGVLGSWGKRGRECDKVSLSLSAGSEAEPSQKWFYCNLNSTDGLY